MKKNTVTTEKKETATKPKRFAVIVNKEQVLETSSYNTVVGEIEKLKADKTPVIKVTDSKENKTTVFTKINNASNYKITAE